MTWQDPVALGLVVVIMALSLGWRKRLLAKGESGCAKCPTRERKARPTRVALSKLRLNQRQ